MLFTRSAQGFICRYTREADYDTENTYAAMAIEEVQKLWGTIQNTSIKGFPGWYLVSSRRGSQILLPPQFSETIKMTGEIGIRVCRYLKVSDNYEAEGLLQYADEKLMEVCQWPKREEGC